MIKSLILSILLIVATAPAFAMQCVQTNAMTQKSYTLNLVLAPDSTLQATLWMSSPNARMSGPVYQGTVYPSQVSDGPGFVKTTYYGRNRAGQEIMFALIRSQMSAQRIDLLKPELVEAMSCQDH